MKKLLFAILLVVQSLLATEATAGVCVTGSVASYVSLGAGGCTIGGTTVTDFSVNGLVPGATPFPSITITPVEVGSDVGLDFTVGISALAGTAFESRISYQVTATSAAGIDSSTITLNGAASSVDGLDVATQTLCIDGQFLDPQNDPSTCKPGGFPTAQIVAFIDGVVDVTTSTLNYPSLPTLAVMNDVYVIGGTAGSATLDSVSNRFGVVPEPAPLLLIGAGLVAVFLRRTPRRGGLVRRG